MDDVGYIAGATYAAICIMYKDRRTSGHYIVRVDAFDGQVVGGLWVGVRGDGAEGRRAVGGLQVVTGLEIAACSSRRVP